MQAEVVIDYKDKRLAQSVAKAVSPDNFKTPRGLSIKTTRRLNNVMTKIAYDGELSTFIATLDDLLLCVSTAEKTVWATKKLE